MSDHLPADDTLTRVRRAMIQIRVLGMGPADTVVMAPDVDAALKMHASIPWTPPADGHARVFGIPIEVVDTLPLGCWYLETAEQTARRHRAAAHAEMRPRG